MRRFNEVHDGGKWGNGYNQIGGSYEKVSSVWRKKPEKPSYAQIVKNKHLYSKSWKGVEFDTEELEADWIKDSFVEHLHSLDNLDSLEDNFILGEMSFLKVRYLGDNMVLITSLWMDLISLL